MQRFAPATPRSHAISSWLDEHDRAGEERFLDGIALDARLASTPSLAGRSSGRTACSSLSARAGSGSVWLAERCDGRFEGRAAIKLLNLSLVGRSGQERFRREGSILARLQHPHIAQLADAGITQNGQPYLVLEFVDGQPIDRYADARALDVEGRLRLFLDVLDGVAHAHASLIVHRDIKPANVLVSVDGSVKLLDFGIAKLVDGDDVTADASHSPEAAALTRELSRALTPEYAAPEQLVGAPVTTATDIYALGVLLYVLLTGRHPAGRAVRTPNTLIRAIVDEEPLRVSEAIADASPGVAVAETHAARCGTTPSRLRRQLQGDLDTIVAKALKKDLIERYTSVSALADDVRRYLRHEPISARADTVGYRATRFVRRHMLGVFSVLGMVLVIGTMTGMYTHRLATARDRAQRESAKAVKVSGMLMGALSSADPYGITANGDRPDLRQLLDVGASQVERELAGEPELQAELLTMLGRTYRRLGAYERSEGLLEQALEGARGAFGPEHLRVAQALQDLGVVHGDRGHYADARRCLEDALAMRRRLQPQGDAELGVLLAELGRVYQDQGFDDRAEAMHREALAVRRTLLGERHRETAVSENNLASVMRLRGDPRRRGSAAPALAGTQHRDTWTATSQYRHHTARPRAHFLCARRLRDVRIGTARGPRTAARVGRARSSDRGADAERPGARAGGRGSSARGVGVLSGGAGHPAPGAGYRASARGHRDVEPGRGAPRARQPHRRGPTPARGPACTCAGARRRSQPSPDHRAGRLVDRRRIPRPGPGDGSLAIGACR